MSTHALTIVRDSDEKSPILLAIYTQFDGYFDGHGDALHRFLKNITITNGLPLGDDRNLANGMGCLAAQLVAHLKRCPGNHYIVPSDTGDREEFMYEIYLRDGKIHLTGQGRNEQRKVKFLPTTLEPIISNANN